MRLDPLRACFGGRSLLEGILSFCIGLYLRKLKTPCSGLKQQQVTRDSGLYKYIVEHVAWLTCLYLSLKVHFNVVFLRSGLSQSDEGLFHFLVL